MERLFICIVFIVVIFLDFRFALFPEKVNDKDYIISYINANGLKMDKNKMYILIKKTNMITIMDRTGGK